MHHGLTLGLVCTFFSPSTTCTCRSSSRAIWVTEYGCTGDESELTSCATHYAIGYAPGCSTTTDAGLTCGGEWHGYQA